MIYSKDTGEESDTLCEKCGHKMIHYVHGDSSGYICNNCGYGWARQYIDPMLEDEGPYTLQLDAIPEPTLDNIRVAARLVKCGYAEAKSRLQNGEISKTGEAVEIAAAAQDLKDAGYLFRITPDFPYPY